MWWDDAGGEGPVVVLLHAFPLSSVMWRPLVPVLRGSARVVCVDLPGLGRSEVPAAEPSMEAMARAVLAVLEGLGVERATYVGLSTGGYVALALAALAPERVDALVLGSTTPWVMAPDLPDDRRAVADEVEATGSTDALLGSADAGLGGTARATQPGLRELLRGVIAAADPAGVAWVARAIASRADTSGVLRDLDRPVLLVFGDEDTETPPERGRAMAELREPGSSTRLEVLAGTGHLTALEQPARFAAVLAPWLAQVGEEAAMRHRIEEVRRDARRARERAAERDETEVFVRQLGFAELLDDDE